MIAKQYLNLVTKQTEDLQNALLREDWNAVLKTCWLMIAVSFPGQDKAVLQERYNEILNKVNAVNSELEGMLAEQDVKERVRRKLYAQGVVPLVYCFIDAMYTLLHARDAFTAEQVKT